MGNNSYEYKGLEACIIHRVKDYPIASYIDEFMEWIGISHFDFVYYEEHYKMNFIIERETTRFDFILYINDDGSCKERYSDLADVNISLNLKDEFNVDDLSIIEVWNQLGAYCNSKYRIFPSVFSELFNVYRECGLFYVMINKGYIFNYSVDLDKEEQLLREMEKYKNQWQDAINKIEDILSVYQNKVGSEYLIYAKIYAQWKIRDDFFMSRKKFSDYSLPILNNIYKLTPNFYRIEYLKANIVGDEIEDVVYAILFMQNCIDCCKVNVCNSLYYIEMGNLCDKMNRNSKKWQLYKDAYKINPLNFRAGFQFAVKEYFSKNYAEASDTLNMLIENLTANVETNYYFLPPLELQYVCKSLNLLVRIEGNKKYYDRIENIIKNLKHYKYLRIIFKDDDIYRKVIASFKLCLNDIILLRTLLT